MLGVNHQSGIFLRKVQVNEMPKSEEDVSKWCKDIFVANAFFEGIFSEEPEDEEALLAVAIRRFWRSHKCEE